DSSEPIGPSAVLHSKAFFSDCRTALTKGGVLVSQNGLPFLFPEHLAGTTRVFQALFKRVAPYLCHQPCYFGGPFALNLATDDKSVLKVTEKDLAKRAEKRSVSDLKYWTPAVHLGAFGLPAYMAETVKQAKADAKAGDDSGYAMPEPVKKAAAKKASSAKKTPAKRAAAKTPTAEKNLPKKAAAKKPATKKPPIKKPAAKKATGSVPAKRAAAKKPVAKKSAAKKASPAKKKA
ncbi:MAG: hypothetical protein AAFR75_05905, partial [Pseudomonadota bacterium]